MCYLRIGWGRDGGGTIIEIPYKRNSIGGASCKIHRMRGTTRGEEVFKEMAFYTNDASKGWNGIYKGVPQKEDVYVYVIEVVCENGQALTFKGDVTLIR